MLLFLLFAVVGAVGTVVTKRDPGALLGILIVIGSVVAALCIQRRAVYKLLPLPALSYLVLATMAGAYHDRKIDVSKTELGLNFLQWMGSGFLAISASTILILVIMGGRLLASRLLVSGEFRASAGRPPAGRPPAGRPPRTSLASGGQPERRRGDRPPWDDGPHGEPGGWDDRGSWGPR